MAVKHFTKFQVSLISDKGGEVSIIISYCTLLLVSPYLKKKYLNPPIPKMCTSTNDNEALYRVILEEK
jgi:hypothetical protein